MMLGRPSVGPLDLHPVLTGNKGAPLHPVLTGNKGAPLSASLEHKQTWAYAFLI
jgi:hypothetical protein